MYFILSNQGKDLPHMSIVYRKPLILALLLLVVFVALITLFVVLSFVTHNNVVHLAAEPDVIFPFP
jgi:hypothetical protein